MYPTGNIAVEAKISIDETLFAEQAVTLPRNWKIGIGFDGSNQSIDQFYHHRGYGNLSTSISKEFKKPRLNLYVRANDILKKSYSGDRALFIPYSSSSYNDKQTVTFGLTYRFGKQTVKIKEVSKDNNLEEANKRSK